MSTQNLNTIVCTNLEEFEQDSLIEVLNVAESKVMQSYYDTLHPKEFQPSDYHEIDQERDDLDNIMEQHDGDMYGGLDSAEVLLVEQYEELLRTQFTEQDFADNDGAGELSIYGSPASHASTAVARSMLKQHLNKRQRKKRAAKFVYYIRGIACGAKFTHRFMDRLRESLTGNVDEG